MVQITSPAPYSISRPQDVIDIVNKNSAVNASAGVIFIALGGILIDAYQAAMVGFGNKYIAAQFGISRTGGHGKRLCPDRCADWRSAGKPRD
jgi:hypothetical protein